MNILFLALEPPYPPNDGGRLRTFNLLQQVAKAHSVTLVTFASLKAQPADPSALSGICEEIHLLPLPVVARARPVERLEAIRRGRPLALRLFASRAMAATLATLVEKGEYDVVHVDQIYLAQYRELLGKIPVVLTHHNVEAEQQRRLLLAAADRYRPYWWLRWLELGLWHRYEQCAVARFDVNCPVSEVNAAYLRRYAAGRPIVVVPNGVDLALYRRPTGPRATHSLLFVGSMDYAPNVDAVLWFCEQILPLIRRQVPAVRLTIVGRSPPSAVRRLAVPGHIEVTGTVESVLPYFWGSEVKVVPLRAGSGTRLKILEAMAATLPVVTTTIGCEGLDLREGQDLLLADEPAHFAATTARLLRDERLRAEMAGRAAASVAKKYGWERVGRRQIDAYRLALETAG